MEILTIFACISIRKIIDVKTTFGERCLRLFFVFNTPLNCSLLLSHIEQLTEY